MPNTTISPPPPQIKMCDLCSKKYSQSEIVPRWIDEMLGMAAQPTSLAGNSLGDMIDNRLNLHVLHFHGGFVDD